MDKKILLSLPATCVGVATILDDIELPPEDMNILRELWLQITKDIRSNYSYNGQDVDAKIDWQTTASLTIFSGLLFEVVQENLTTMNIINRSLIVDSVAGLYYMLENARKEQE